MNRFPAQDHSLRDVLQLLWRQRWLVLACASVALAAVFAYSLTRTSSYEASAEIRFVDLRKDLGDAGLSVPTRDLPEPVEPRTERVTAPAVVRGVSRQIGTNQSVEDIRASVTAEIGSPSNAVTITARDENSGLRAQRLANAFAEETRRNVTRAQRGRLLDAAAELRRFARDEPNTPSRANLRDRANELEAFADLTEPVTVSRPAITADDPESLSPLYAILALLLGLAVAVLLALRRDSLDPRLTDSHEVQRYVGFPLIGYFGDHLFNQNGPPSADDDLDAFRLLSSNVALLASGGSLTTVAVTSGLAGEGRSTVSAGLALASARAGKRVVLVECDLRRPVLAERLGLERSPGLADWLAGDAAPSEVLQQVPGAAGLSVIVAGDEVAQPAELLGSQRFAEFIEEVRPVLDLVVLDCPSIFAHGDPPEVLAAADSILLCVRLGHTTKREALGAKNAIEGLGPPPTGLVVTGVPGGQQQDQPGYQWVPAKSRRPAAS